MSVQRCQRRVTAESETRQIFLIQVYSDIHLYRNCAIIEINTQVSHSVMKMQRTDDQDLMAWWPDIYLGIGASQMLSGKIIGVAETFPCFSFPNVHFLGLFFFIQQKGFIVFVFVLLTTKKLSPQCGNMPWPIYEGTFPQRLIVNLIFPYITAVYTWSTL